MGGTINIMYLQDDKIEKDVLRQGDIIIGTQIIGALNLKEITYITNNEGERLSWAVPVEPKFQEAIVLSHSCEIDLANEIKVTSIILSPLRDVNKATEPQYIEEVKRTNIITSDSTESFLKYFYLPPHPSIPYSDGCIVDFSKCYSVRNKSYDLLLQNKKAQLEESYSDKLALKLALYFYRTQHMKELIRNVAKLSPI